MKIKNNNLIEEPTLAQEEQIKKYGKKENWKFGEWVCGMETGPFVELLMKKLNRKKNSVRGLIDQVYHLISVGFGIPPMGYDSHSKIFLQAFKVANIHNQFYKDVMKRRMRKIKDIQVKTKMLRVLE